MMEVAVNEEKQYIHVSDACRGMDCNCFCLECGEPVAAKKGKRRAHHFSHLSGRKPCKLNAESLFNFYARRFLMMGDGINVPDLNPKNMPLWLDFDEPVGPYNSQNSHSRIYIKSGGETILIKMKVPISKKRRKCLVQHTEDLRVLESEDLRVLEIDLSMLKGTKINAGEMQTLIVEETSNKKWVLNERFVPGIIGKALSENIPIPAGSYEVRFRGYNLGVSSNLGGVLKVHSPKLRLSSIGVQRQFKQLIAEYGRPVPISWDFRRQNSLP